MTQIGTYTMRCENRISLEKPENKSSDPYYGESRANGQMGQCAFHQFMLQFSSQLHPACSKRSTSELYTTLTNVR